jgi:hypothetical protein
MVEEENVIQQSDENEVTTSEQQDADVKLGSTAAPIFDLARQEPSKENRLAIADEKSRTGMIGELIRTTVGALPDRSNVVIIVNLTIQSKHKGKNQSLRQNNNKYSSSDILEVENGTNPKANEDDNRSTGRQFEKNSGAGLPRPASSHPGEDRRS